VNVIAVLARDLVASRALSEEGSGDTTVNSAFLLEAVTRQSYGKTPVLQFRGLEDFVGLGVADLP
jgi:hypothetical protein